MVIGYIIYVTYSYSLTVNYCARRLITAGCVTCQHMRAQINTALITHARNERSLRSKGSGEVIHVGGGQVSAHLLYNVFICMLRFQYHIFCTFWVNNQNSFRNCVFSFSFILMCPLVTLVKHWAESLFKGIRFLLSHRTFFLTSYLLISFICQKDKKNLNLDKFLVKLFVERYWIVHSEYWFIQASFLPILSRYSRAFNFLIHSLSYHLIICYVDLTWLECFAMGVNMIIFMMYVDLKLVARLYRVKIGRKDALDNSRCDCSGGSKRTQGTCPHPVQILSISCSQSHCQSFNIVPITADILKDKTGYTSLFFIKVSIEKIKGTAHKSGDVDGKCKRALIFHVFVRLGWRLISARWNQRSRSTADYHCSNIINSNPVQTNGNSPLQRKHRRVITVKPRNQITLCSVLCVWGLYCTIQVKFLAQLVYDTAVSSKWKYKFRSFKENFLPLCFSCFF